MLDAIDPTNLLTAVEAWQPDAKCIAAGDEYVQLAIRCYAAAGLSNAQITQFMRDWAGVNHEVNTADRHEAPRAIARHCAMMDMPLHQIIAVLAYCAAEVPCWPDADDIGEIAEAAVAECAA